MALFAKKHTLIDQPSEDVIDLSAEEAVAEVALAESGRRRPSGTGGRAKVLDLKVLGIMLFLTVIAIGWLFFQNARQAERDTRYIEQSSQMLMLSQRLAKDAREAVLGRETAFKTLAESRKQFETIINGLKDGSATIGIPPSPGEVQRKELLELQNVWAPKPNAGMRAQVDQILSQEEALFALRDHVLAINQLSPLLLSITDEIVELGVNAGMNQKYLYIASRQGMLSQRIAKDVNLFAQGGDDAAVAAAQFGKDSKLFKDTELRLRKVAPPGIRTKLNEAAEVFEQAAAWYGQGQDVILLGFENAESSTDLERLLVRSRSPDFAAALRRVKIGSLAALLAHELLPAGVIQAARSRAAA